MTTKYCKLCKSKFETSINHPQAQYCSNKCNQKAYQIKHADELYLKRKKYREIHDEKIKSDKSRLFQELKKDKKAYELFKLKTKLSMLKYRQKNSKI